jgi:serine protease 16
VVGEAYTNPLVGGSDACFSVISEGHAQIQKLLATAEGRRQLETDFHVCGRSALDDAMNQVQFASDGVAYFPAQSNDPSCTDDLCNIAKVCSALLAATAGDGSAYSRLIALSRSQNGNACKPVSHDALVAVYLPSNSPSRIWQFQTCSEWGFYMTCPTGSKCPFVQGLASLESSLDICKKAFGIEEATIRDSVDKANARYGGSNFKCERVLFVNGEVDPWRASSVQLDTGYPSEPIHLSLGTSHHFWTHEPLPTDGKYVGDSRTTIFAQLDEWLQQRQQQAKK